MTLSSDKKISSLAADAVLLCVALALSYAESLLPLGAIPLPGFKPGLSNIAVTVAAFRSSPTHAAAVSTARVAVMFLMFGNATSSLFSLCGSLLVIAALFVLRNHHGGLSFIGIALICALAHNAGQLAASFALVGSSVLAYAPFLALASLIFGSVSGVILNVLPEKIYKP